MRTTAYAVFSLISLQVAAQTEQPQWHGFISQGLIKAYDNNFVNDEKETSWRLTEIGINTSWRINPELRFAAQGVYLNGGNRYEEGGRLDYAFFDWSAYSSMDWQLNLYAGRYKNEHWLYSSTRDVPFTRSSIVLAQSVYFDGFRDIAVGSDGLALKATNAFDWGELDILWSYGSSSISDKQTAILFSEYATGGADQDFVHQASTFWRPATSNWQFGISLLDSDFKYNEGNNDLFEDGDFTVQRFMLNAIFYGEVWEFSSELFQERVVVDGFRYAGFELDQKGQGIYVQSRYSVNDKLKLVVRYDNYDANKDDRSGRELEENTNGAIPHYFAFQNDWTLGFSLDLDERIRLQAEYHFVEGTARSVPTMVPDVTNNNKKNWQMWAVQLMYWF